ncbi:MAG: cytochrome c oxidase assembly protein [Actinomycetota bacterium]|nr:cytochrome c oxidase assembly protein [Actinomycetota bacterium]MDH5225282.1 cytochrome c oxidase assembly protein [Actinomycetota bacterium]MDH5312751.1 cytochrome c oxidase assembly protein [Actinomycetota bacterium]
MGASLPDDMWAALGRWVFEPITVAMLVAIGSAYVAGLVRARRLGRPTSARRWAPFAVGWLALALALVSPIDAYAEVSFTLHMLQHLLLTLVAPPLLAIGAPLALALSTLPTGGAKALASALRSPVARVIANPVVGWSLFVSVPIAVHASRLFDVALGASGWHAAEHALWVAVALVYWWPIVGVDPSPHPVAYPVRLLSLLLAMPAMSFLALGIYTADSPLYATYAGLPAPWGPRALHDQRNAAVLMWVAGNLVMVLAMVLVAVSWKRHDDEAQRRLEAREDAVRATT